MSVGCNQAIGPRPYIIETTTTTKGRLKMSSPARRKELEAMRQEASRRAYLEQVRVSSLSIYERMSEADTVEDMKAVIELVCERAGINIYE